MVSHRCLSPLSCCLDVLPVLSHRPSLCCLLFAVTIAVLFICRVACRCCSSSATARLCIACHAYPPLSFPTVLLLEGVAHPQPPPGCLLFAVTIAVLSICRVACRCCSSSATARPCTACRASPHLSFPAVLLLAGVAHPQPPPGSLSAVCCHHSCPVHLSCCLQVLLVVSHRPSLYCLSCVATSVFPRSLIA